MNWVNMWVCLGGELLRAIGRHSRSCIDFLCVRWMLELKVAQVLPIYWWPLTSCTVTLIPGQIYWYMSAQWVNGVWPFRWTRTCRHRCSWLCLMGFTVFLASFHIYKSLTRVACKSVWLFTGASADCGCLKYFLEILLVMHLIYVRLGSHWLLWWSWVNLYIRFADLFCPLIVGYSWGEMHLVGNGTSKVPLAHWFCDFSCVKRCCSCWCVKNCVSWVSDCCTCSFCLSGFGCCCVGSSLCCCLCF